MWSPVDILIRTFYTWVGKGAGQCRNPSEYLRRLETKASKQQQGQRSARQSAPAATYRVHDASNPERRIFRVVVRVQPVGPVDFIDFIREHGRNRDDAAVERGLGDAAG